MNWISVNSDIKPFRDRLVICYCPDWNEEQYQIATWDGEEFGYSDQPNDMFNEKVLSGHYF